LQAVAVALSIAGCCHQSASPSPPSIASSTCPVEVAAPHAQASAPAPTASDPDEHFAELGSCKLDSGEVIEDCRVGYRTLGTLDATRSNAVLFPTWFTGKAKMLSKRGNELVDTSRLFLVMVDSLGNGVSSSPSNSTKQPRLRFPRFTIHDMVESQRRLLREKLGVERLYAVMGISMGGMQAFEWAVSHPSEVSRFVSIVGTPQQTAQDLLLWNAELHVLEGSKAYAGGDYAVMPKLPGLQELHWLMLSSPAHRNAETSRAAYPKWAEEIGSDTAFDWNDWHRQLEAMLSHDVARTHHGDLVAAAKDVKAKGLVVIGTQDHMVNPEPAIAFARAMGAQTLALDTPCGHMLPGCAPAMKEAVRKFLAE
jgi:homoserine O-acetyltransferase